MAANSDDDNSDRFDQDGEADWEKHAPQGLRSKEERDLQEPTLDSQELDDDEEEFSLNQLSQAYAKVLRGNAGGDSDETVEFISEPTEAEIASPSTGTKSLVGARTTSLIEERETRDNAGCPITPESIVEALVFVGLPGEEKLTLKKIASLLRDVSPKEVKGIIKQLNARYEKDQSAIRIKLDGTTVSMTLDDSMLAFQQAFSRSNKGVRLNAATIEVLAIIAYSQPVTRDKIDEIRKKPSGAIVTQLVRRELIAAVEGERSGQRQQFITTEKFLDLFHLADLADLPKGSDESELDDLLS